GARITREPENIEAPAGAAPAGTPNFPRRRSEVERHAGRGRLDGRAADGVVELIAAANLVAVAACTEAEVRAHAVLQPGTDQVPAGPRVEPVARADRIHVGRLIEGVLLELAGLHDRAGAHATDRRVGIVEAQAGRSAGRIAGVRP